MQRQEVDMLLIKNRDQKAFCLLFNYYYPFVFRTIHKIVKLNIEAEDLAMVSIEKAFLNIDKYKPICTFSSWITSIARNTAFDFIKKRQLLYDGIENLVVTCKENPENIFIDQEKLEILEKKIDKLQPSYKKLIEILGYDCTPYDTLKKEYKDKKGDLYVEICRARKELKKLLK
jgi:RNA polymerase sigma-70 factor (ECF subfamily)